MFSRVCVAESDIDINSKFVKINWFTVFWSFIGLSVLKTPETPIFAILGNIWDPAQFWGRSRQNFNTMVNLSGFLSVNFVSLNNNVTKSY